MSGFIEIQHDEWVAATPDVVRAYYSDLSHREVARVHPRERLHQFPPGPTGPRYERLLRTRWRRVRDIYERQDRPDGSVLDHCVGGAHWGRALVARFYRNDDDGRVGTLIELTLTQPLRPVLLPLLGRWFRRRLEAELREFAAEIKVDVERGYKAGRKLRVA